jgi:beta-lactamase regulating signal transducer with metallopeptidase domain
MQQLTYSFIVSMMHSIWQTALLLLIYSIYNIVNSQSSPLYKRNLLFSFIGLQIVISICTFYSLYFQPNYLWLQGLASIINSPLKKEFLQTNAPIFFWIYTLVVVYRLTHSFLHWNHFNKQYHQSLIKPSVHLRWFTQSKAYQFGIAKKVMLYCSSNITTAMTFGFWKPIILLPVALVNQLSLQETEALIIHELTHIRNNDFLLNWLLIIAETLFFFNPFVHILSQKIKRERERNCDIQVLYFNYPRILYAETLLKTAQFQQQQLSLQLAAVKNKKHLLQRIHYFSDASHLEYKRNNMVFSRLGLLGALLINLLLVFIETQTNNFVVMPTAKQPFTLNTEWGIKISTMAKSENRLAALPIAVSFKDEKLKRSSTTKTLLNKPVAEILSPIVDKSNFQIVAVSNTESFIEGKEIIINEENTNGKKITAAYKALFVNGVWTLKPIWMLTETRPIIDSLKASQKDSVIRIFPTVQ